MSNNVPELTTPDSKSLTTEERQARACWETAPDIDLFTLTGPYISNRILKTSNIGIPIHPHMEA